ncbi:capreomycin phosphotransferase [Actinosynnema sp. CS-041913]|uniref:capreomycin phosphotransferase n=1 Tax=Actinosynnema sp. CS-041913 TaxID=3239917 RepID=UPI003D9301E4
MTLSHYVAVLRHAGHDLGDVSLHSGQFHDVLIAADRVFRFPKTAAAAAELPRRAALLTALNTLDLGVEIPTPLSDVDPSAPVGDTFLTLSRVPGAPLGHAEAVDAMVAEFARVLRTMADTKPVDVVPAADPHRWTEFAAGVHTGLFPLMDAAGRNRAERELAAVQRLDHVTTGLVHGDLGGENVLWRRTGDRPRLVGIVDWDGAVIGDPAEDLAAVGASYGAGLLDRIITLLGVDRTSAVRRTAAYQGTFALQQALAAARDGDDAELADGLASYR